MESWRRKRTNSADPVEELNLQRAAEILYQKFGIETNAQFD